MDNRCSGYPARSALRLRLARAAALAVAAAWAAAGMGAGQVAGAEAGAAPELVHRAPDGVVFRVTADGLSSIARGRTQIAAGSWSVFNAEHWFKDGGSGLVDTSKLTRKTLEAAAPGRARVVHVRGDVTCTTDYRFAGQDVLISARVENTHASAPLNIVGFAGLTFHFSRPPTGLMPVQHISYFRAHGVRLCHPGFWSRIGGTYATDDTVGVGTSPWATGLTRTLTLWDYTDWGQGRRDTVPSRRLMYFAVSPVPPRGAATFDFRLRVSVKHDWQHLLSPYREHFARTFGPLRYRSDYRWVATDYLNHSQRAVSPTNPYGFHGAHRRIDTDAGSEAFCDKVIPGLKKGGGQGIIVWGQGGDDPRGGMYRPDFDVLPPEVEARWRAMAKQFADAGLKIGVCTRPRHLAVKLNWARDQIIDINPDDPGHRGMIWQRFENMMKRGCSLFYLDSFGASFEDVKLMRFLREKMGPNILTFAEHQCDAMLPYSGGYSETSFSTGAENRTGPHYRLWSGLDNWRIYQFLVPGCQMASRLYQGEKDIPKDFQRPDAFFFSNRISPLVPVNAFSRLEQTKREQDACLSDKGRWK